jgi:hypothetical protein
MLTKSLKITFSSIALLGIFATTLSTFAQNLDTVSLPKDQKIINLGNKLNKILPTDDREAKKEIDNYFSEISTLNGEEVLQLRKQNRVLRADVDEVKNEKNIDKLEKLILKLIQKEFGKDKHFYNLATDQYSKLEVLMKKDAKIKELQNAVISKDTSNFEISKLFGTINASADCPTAPTFTQKYYPQGNGNYSYVYPTGWNTAKTSGTNDCDYRIYKNYAHRYVNGSNFSGGCILNFGYLEGYLEGQHDRVIVGNNRATICGAFSGNVVSASLRFR